ncbi:MAG: hypothetical protein ACRDIL_07970, partial [Candidatus Limnocylindrales bacterium]
LNSPPPVPPGKPQSPPVDRGSSPGTASQTATVAQPNARTVGRPVTGRPELPRTGADLDRLVVAGLAATAGGAALVLWSADAKSVDPHSPESPSDP